MVLWTTFAGAAMVGIFAVCVLAVVVGVRLLERVAARRGRRPSA
jgi:hypothetical protein